MNVTKLFLLSIIVLITFSCDKDSDLLSEFVLNKDSDVILVDDFFYVSFGNSVVLDVLENDNINEEQNITITSTSTPENGIVEINPDNTLTYTPTTSEEATDIFTYTTNQTNESSTTSSEETGTVTINITENQNKNQVTPSINPQALFTPQMVNEIKGRIDNGWAHPSGGGYPEDEAYIIAQKNAFDANVNIGQWDNFNLDNGASIDDAPIPLKGVSDHIHYAAIYAYLYNDNELAQKVVDRIIQYASDSNLDITKKVQDKAFNTENTITSPWLFIAPKMVKFLESYSLCKNLVSITQAENERLSKWFLDWRNLFYDSANFSMEVTWGSGWKSENYSLSDYNRIIGGALFTDSNGGKTAGHYLSTRAQQTGLNNIRCEMWAYIHAYGIYFNHTQSKEDSYTFLKTWLKFNFYSDGTSSELNRAKEGNEQLGISYVAVSLTSMSKAAIMQKIAFENGLKGVSNGNQWLDYKTSEGTSDYPNTLNYVGTSTSGGSKSILSVVKAHLNFFRQYGNQGWSPKRYFNGTVLMDGNLKMEHRPLAAMLNTHFKDPELEAGWKHDSSYGYNSPMTGIKSSGFTDANNGSHGVLYGLMYWAGI